MESNSADVKQEFQWGNGDGPFLASEMPLDKDGSLFIRNTTYSIRSTPYICANCTEEIMNQRACSARRFKDRQDSIEPTGSVSHLEARGQQRKAALGPSGTLIRQEGK